MPEITHAQLQRGVAGYVALGAQLQAWRDALVAERAPTVAAATAVARVGSDDTTLHAALGAWSERSYRTTGAAFAQLAQSAALFRAEDRSDRTVPIAGSTVDWLPLAIAPGALAYLAAAIGISAEHRVALAQLLAAITEDLPDPRKLRVWTTTGVEPGGQWHGGNAYLIAEAISWQSKVRVLEYAPDGVFRELPKKDGSVYASWQGGPPLADGAVAAVVSAAAAGRTSWHADAPAQLAAATGMTPSEAAYLLAGCPNMHDSSANFLPKEAREALGLKSAQAQLARDAMKALPIWKLLSAIDAAGRARDAVPALAAAWIKLFGARAAVPEALVTAADAELATPIKPAVALAMYAATATAPQLTRDHTFGIDVNGNAIIVASPTPLIGQPALANPPAAFTHEVVSAHVQYLPFLFGELPVGDPLRAQIAQAHALVLQRLRSPALIIDAGRRWYGSDEEATLEKLLANLGGTELAGLGDAGSMARALPGAILIRQRSSLRVLLRTSELDARAHAALAPVLSGLHSTTSTAIELVRSPDFAALAARITDTPVPAGGWEQDPRASAPEIVARAQKRLGVSRDAAALYLQYLALLWPIPKLLAMWNGYKPKVLVALQAELVAAELLLEAKRERAQRGHFLPGAWEPLKSPFPALEAWKVPLYGGTNAHGDVQLRLPRMLALAPFHLLFERAWARIEAGDVPKYDEVKR